MESQASWVEKEVDMADLGGSEHGKVEVKGRVVDAGGGGGAHGGDGDGDASPGLSVNLERGLVLHGGAADGSSNDEEEFDFDEEEGDGNVQVQWFAVARFFSSRTVRARLMFSELSNAWGEVRSHDLGDNGFLLEFPTENALNFVLKDSKNVGSIVSDLEVEALSTAMANKLKLEQEEIIDGNEEFDEVEDMGSDGNSDAMECAEEI
ncbi:hypothetical protein HU200_039199 [Digitaria exilis]|uniref:Uncharacterized protein n=1 Tax=Digitaria exilis TaxID=1010633 RepID=A0A835BC25_9POAL|nr:hypothetical protein HU200_039199 [Digitaria exilis]